MWILRCLGNIQVETRVWALVEVSVQAKLQVTVWAGLFSWDSSREGMKPCVLSLGSRLEALQGLLEVPCGLPCVHSGSHSISQLAALFSQAPAVFVGPSVLSAAIFSTTAVFLTSTSPCHILSILLCGAGSPCPLELHMKLTCTSEYMPLSLGKWFHGRSEGGRKVIAS